MKDNLIETLFFVSNFKESVKRGLVNDYELLGFLLAVVMLFNLPVD